MINRSGSHLETLQLEASIQARRAQIIESLLPTELKHEVAPGDLNFGLLTLYVPKAALAAKLRFEEYSLIELLRIEPLFRGIRRIQCRVRPRRTKGRYETKKTNKSSPGAGALIQDFATTLKDGELKRRFQQLAARVSGNLPPGRT